MKKVVTHTNPDTDAIAAVWLIKRFLPGWEDARVDYVQTSSSSAKDPSVDSNPDTLYVDVGRGMLDHHQTGTTTCATKKCWDYIRKNRHNHPFNKIEKKALDLLAQIETEIDNARDIFWEEVSSPRYYFYFHTLIDGLRGCGESDEKVMEYGFRSLEAILLNLKAMIVADEDIKSGQVFQTPWGKAIALASGNKLVTWRGEVAGYALVVKKDPDSGGVRIYSRNDSGVDLTSAYKQFMKMDPGSDWFLHKTKRLLLNQSRVNQSMRLTKLSLDQVIDVLKKK